MFKRSVGVIAFVFMLAFTVGVTQADLVGHWKLDDGSGDVAADATGNGHDGTLIGGPEWVAGYFDGALEFTGSPQKVDIPYSAQLNPEGEFTVSVWANVDPGGSGHRSPVTSRDDFPQRGYILYVEPGNTWQFWMGIGTGWNNAAGPAAALGEWTHVAGVYSPGQQTLYINGEQAAQASGTVSPNTQQVLRIGGGATEGTGNYFFVGTIDDVRVYDHALSEAQMAAVMAGEPYPFAAAPKPSDGSMIESQQAMLQWSPGELAASHNVYLGEDLDAVANATPDDADVFLGSATDNRLVVGSPLTPGATYYWRVDAVNDADPASPWKGEVWSFWVQPAIAWAPSPTEGAKYIDPNQDVTWSGGMGALFHTVYFGQDFEEVSSAAAGGWMTPDVTYDPGPLELDTVYYWRVDEFTPTGTLKGEVWSLTTMPAIAVTDPSLLAWWTLDEGVGGNVVDWSGHGHHGTLAGDTQWVGGYAGTALEFDGSGDYVSFGTPSDLYLPQDYTYIAWFKVGRNVFGNSGPQYLLCVGSRSDLVLGIEDLVGVDGDVSLHYYDTAASFHAVGAGQTMWSSEEWHMVAGTKDAAVGHKIYLDGELRGSDTNTNDDNYATTRIISLGARAWTGHQYYRGMIDEVRIYNRALTEEEINQLLRVNPLLAWDPTPARDAAVDIREVTSLRWLPGDTAASHDVYLGSDREAVAGADNGSAEYQGNQPGTSFSLAGLVEFGGGAYFWRIDEVEADGTVHTGDVWKLTVPAYLKVDDFEGYTDDIEGGKAIYQTWIDGWENNTGSTVGYLQSSGQTFGETTIVHGGGQSMPLDYNNVNSPYYSETERTFAPPQNWTVNGVDTLTLYVRGGPGNDPAPLYVGLESGATRVNLAYGDETLVRSTLWVEVSIPLADFAGVDAAAVSKMYISIGDPDAPAPGGAGLIYVDDIRATKSALVE